MISIAQPYTLAIRTWNDLSLAFQAPRQVVN
jgi:hypothetical protein